jgi:citrate synthase
VKNKANNLRLYGFGHRIYKCLDPRAQVIKGMCAKVIEVTKKPFTLWAVINFK